MHWNYDRATGNLRDSDGLLAALCYSGHGPGLNNPAKEQEHDVGPLPAGLYTLVEVLSRAELERLRLGPRVFQLIPDPANNMYGRSGFYLHWRRTAETYFNSSHGCIVPVTDFIFPKLANGDTLKAA